MMGNEWQDWLSDKSMDQELKTSQNQEFKQRQNLFEESIHILNDREKEILYARRLRLMQNDSERYFEKINIKAVELAKSKRHIKKEYFNCRRLTQSKTDV